MNNKLSVHDASIIRHILKYCGEIEDTLAFFGDDERIFMGNAIFRNAVSMPIQQIGELAKHLSNEFIEAHPEIAWRQVKGMRDWFAHQYIKMDIAVIWTVAKEDLPPLKAFFEKILATKEEE